MKQSNEYVEKVNRNNSQRHLISLQEEVLKLCLPCAQNGDFVELTLDKKRTGLDLGTGCNYSRMPLRNRSKAMNSLIQTKSAFDMMYDQSLTHRVEAERQ
jgi:hypothetical protein